MTSNPVPSSKTIIEFARADHKEAAIKKLIDAWNSKNTRAAKRAGSFGFMAAALAACGGGGHDYGNSGGDDGAADSTFRFLTGTSASLSAQPLRLSSLDAATENARENVLDVADRLGAAEEIDISAGLIVPADQTFVGDISLFDSNGGEGIPVRGGGNLWVLAPEGEFDSNNEQTVILTITLDGGRLTFDMPSDDYRLIIDNASQIDIGGGTLQISDGDVFVSAVNYASWNIGAPLIVSSSITIDFRGTTLSDTEITEVLRALRAETDAGNTSSFVRILLDDDALAALVFDALQANSSLSAPTAPKVEVVSSETGVAIVVDFEAIVESKITFLTKSLSKKIEDLKAAVEGEDYSDAAYKDIAKLSAQLVSLEGIVGSVAADGGATTVGEILERLRSDLEEAVQSAEERLDEIMERLEPLEAQPLDWAVFDGDNRNNTISVAEIFGEPGANGSFTVLNTFIEGFGNRIAGFDPATVPLSVKGDLTVAQAVALAQASLAVNTENVTYSIRDAYTTIQSALTSPQANAALAGATKVVAVANNNPNLIDMTAFDDSIALRIEALGGDDTILSGPGGHEIVGGRGADVIWLTDDTSSDTVIYESLLDGRVLPLSVVSFSDDPNNYLEGTMLTITVNGRTIDYTTDSDATVADALSAFADVISKDPSVSWVKVHDGNALNISGVDGERLRVSAGENALVNEGRLPRVDITFPEEPGDYPTEGPVRDGSVVFPRHLTLSIADPAGEEDIVISVNVVYNDGAADPVATIEALRVAVQSALEDDGELAGIIGRVRILDDDLTLRLEAVAVPAGGEDGSTLKVESVAISTPGTKQEIDVTFSDNDNDYFTGGKLSVTISGVVIPANMVAGDAEASIDALFVAIQALLDEAEPDAGSDADLIQSVLDRVQLTSGSTTLKLMSFLEDDRPMAVTARLDFEGEVQSATASLRDIGEYTFLNRLDGEDSPIAAPGGREASVYFEGGRAYIVIDILDGDKGVTNSITVGADMGADQNDTADNLVAAIQARIGDAEDTLSGVLARAEAVDGLITLVAAEVGQQTFAIADFRLDYEGVSQIATADFSDFDNFDDGELSIVIAQTDTDGNVIKAFDAITVNMGLNAAASRQALVDSINFVINSDRELPAVLNFSGPFTEDMKLYVELDEPLLGRGILQDFIVDLEVSDAFGRIGIFKSDQLNLVATPDDLEFPTIGSLIAAINNEENGILAFLESGDIIFKSEATGSDITLTSSVAFNMPALGDISTELSGADSVPSELSAALSEAILEDGIITLVSAEKTIKQFTILEAFVTVAGQDGAPVSTKQLKITNPGDAGGETYFGDKPFIGEIDSDGVFNGHGIRQSFTNPDNGFDDDVDSPLQAKGEVTAGDSTLFGSNPGFHTEEGLFTTFLRDGELVTGETTQTDEGELDLYVPRLDQMGVSFDEIEKGSAPGSVSFGVLTEQDGFGYFDAHANITDITREFSKADIINNFQVEKDLIALEGDLLASTVVGPVQIAVANPLRLDAQQPGELSWFFDLSEYEFGLVSSATNEELENVSLTVDDLGAADAVAALLSAAFPSIVSLPNGILNTTIFAITASDDQSVTAIWAHQQSVDDDDTIEEAELFHLSTINTIAGEFLPTNFGEFDIIQVGSSI